MRTGIFVGSFDPFTIGHDSIVRRALPLFDKLVIGVGVNDKKKYTTTTDERVKAIQSVYANEPKVEVVAFSDCTMDLAKRVGAGFIVKGVRNVRDFEFERDQAEINRLMGNIETILLYSEPELACVSSSAVRELRAFGKDVDKFLPKGK